MLTANDILSEKNREMLSVDTETTIYSAIQIMNENKIGAILVKENGKIVGIWTERDLLHNVLDPGFNIAASKIKDFMSKNLLSISYDHSIYRLLDTFLGKRIRHLLVEKDGQFIGLISQGDVVKASLNEKSKEVTELNDILKWEYYENWRFNWKKQ